MKKTFQAALLLLAFCVFACNKNEETASKNTVAQSDSLALPTLENADAPLNFIFVLSDDHRYDFMGFMQKVPWLQTPYMDQMAAEGTHFANAFVQTALCSPSRATILTGMYSFQHTVVDNQAPEPDNLTWFPQYLQQAGYQTGYFGKWHIGHESEKPKKGFDKWIGFPGQGKYYSCKVNVDGQMQQLSDSTYISYYLTEQALRWMDGLDANKPFMLYLSHKGVHEPFNPSAQHKGMYKNETVTWPTSYNPPKGTPMTNAVTGEKSVSPGPLSNAEYQYDLLPDWVKAQRYSWHGVDYAYHGREEMVDNYRNYCEALAGVDSSLGAVLKYVQEKGLAERTVIVYMGDNGFSFGEHGLIDKRHAYEESMRVPMIAWGAGVPKGKTVKANVMNTAIAPTAIHLAGLQAPKQFVGKSLTQHFEHQDTDGENQDVPYTYFWDYEFPMTPTMHAWRGERYKFIRYFGIWSRNELYDMQNDPNELRNLITEPALQDTIKQMQTQLFNWLEANGGLQVPVKPTRNPRFGDWKHPKEY